MYSESEESDLDSIEVWTGDPLAVAQQLCRALEQYDWTLEVQAALMAHALDTEEAHWDVFSPDGEQRIRVSFRYSTTMTAVGEGT